MATQHGQFRGFVVSKARMSGERSVFRSIFRNVSVLTLGRIANALCSFIYIALAVRALGLSDFGLLILIHSLASTSSVLSRMQSWQTLIRFGSESFGNGDTDILHRVIHFCIRLDTISAACAIVFGLVGVQIYGHTAHWSAHVRFLADLYMFVSPLMYSGWANGILRMAGKFHLVPIIDSCAALVKTFGVLLGDVLHLKLGYFLFIWAMTIVIDYGFYIHYALDILHRKFQFRYFRAFRHWRWQLPGMWQFTRAASVNQTLGNISGHVATLLVGNGLGPAEAAVFRVCRQIADGIVTPAQLISPVLYPELVRMRDRQDWRGLKRVTWKMFGVLSGLSVALLLLSAFFGSTIFRFLLHVHVHHTSLYISIMLLAAVFSLLVIPLEPLLIVVGHVKFLMTNRTAIMTVYFPALYVLTRHFGLAGACLSTAACNATILLSQMLGVWFFYDRIGKAER
ncbi:lipopolysaccharide biosynthesis protein [Gluconobacter oxydans]|uniref:lipopolysaccharide biosynthesis protein n=1 Tax=Gluconobacter oxydans TaxID=442 RepID=UPI00346399D4